MRGNPGLVSSRSGPAPQALVLWERALGLTPTGRDGAVLHELMVRRALRSHDFCTA